jgi:hypothetical protein
MNQVISVGTIYNMLNNITVSIKLKNNNLVLCIDVMKTLNFPNKTSFISTINFKKGERFKLNSMDSINMRARKSN